MSANHHAARRENPLARLTRKAMARRQAPAPEFSYDRDGRSELYLAAERHHEAPATLTMPMPPGMPGIDTRTWVPEIPRAEARMADHDATMHYPVVEEAPTPAVRPLTPPPFGCLPLEYPPAVHQEPSPVHMVARYGEMPCCGLRETQVPRTDRVTMNPRLVTCRTAAHDTMPDDRAPMPRPYTPGPLERPYIPGPLDLHADIRDLPFLRDAIRDAARRQHAGCDCEPADDDAAWPEWFAVQYTQIIPGEPVLSWWTMRTAVQDETRWAA
jgi:hypothetical protein